MEIGMLKANLIRWPVASNQRIRVAISDAGFFIVVSPSSLTRH